MRSELPQMTDCDALPTGYLARSVAGIPELAARLEQISIDAVNRVQILRCRHCGQLWEEWHRVTGGEVANVRKIVRSALTIFSIA